MCKLLATEIFIKMKINVLQMLLKFMLLHILYMFHGAFWEWQENEFYTIPH